MAHYKIMSIITSHRSTVFRSQSTAQENSPQTDSMMSRNLVAYTSGTKSMTQVGRAKFPAISPGGLANLDGMLYSYWPCELHYKRGLFLIYTNLTAQNQLLKNRHREQKLGK